MGRIRNRDIAVLEDVTAAMQEVCRYEDMSEWQGDRIFSITRMLTGMPCASGGAKGLDNSLSKLEAAQERYAGELEKCLRLLEKAESIINSIENREMRNFVVLMYVMKLPPAEVRRELNMSEWSFRQARQKVEQARSMRDVDKLENT
ncbi:MAG: hypothetical protein IJ466_07245 [Clostridia bacterium]|nr:hypothetical protein [Clostridia bacterium]